MLGGIIMSTSEQNLKLMSLPNADIVMQRFVDRDMLMRYHWGLGISHTYSHTQDGTVDQAASMRASPAQGFQTWSSTLNSAPTGTSYMDTRPSLGFDDFDNDFSLSDLEWEWLGNHDSGNAES